MTYKIVRFYAPGKVPSKYEGGAHVVKRGLSLEEAQKHCNDPKTRKAGQWFDGYTAEN